MVTVSQDMFGKCQLHLTEFLRLTSHPSVDQLGAQRGDDRLKHVQNDEFPQDATIQTNDIPTVASQLPRGMLHASTDLHAGIETEETDVGPKHTRFDLH